MRAWRGVMVSMLTTPAGRRLGVIILRFSGGFLRSGPDGGPDEPCQNGRGYKFPAAQGIPGEHRGLFEGFLG